VDVVLRGFSCASGSRISIVVQRFEKVVVDADRVYVDCKYIGRVDKINVGVFWENFPLNTLYGY
jgi:hypothetical protein